MSSINIRSYGYESGGAGLFIGDVFASINGLTHSKITQESLPVDQYGYTLPAVETNDWNDVRLAFDWTNYPLSYGGQVGSNYNDRELIRVIRPFITPVSGNYSAPISRFLNNWGTYVVIDDIWNIPTSSASYRTMTFTSYGDTQATSNAPTRLSHALARGDVY